MRTFMKILTLSALLFALCQAASPAMISLKDKEVCNALGIGATSGTPQCKVDAIAGKCQKGFHLADKKCLPNTFWCAKKKYDKVTFNCASCKWYAFHVQNDGQTTGTKNGNYCETRWWWVTLWAVLALIGLIAILAIIKFLCCKPKAPKEGKRLLDSSKARGSTSKGHRSNELVEVHRERPQHYETREVHRESPVRHQPVEVHRERPVHYENREVIHGSQVHNQPREVIHGSPAHYGQTRTAYSPYKNAQDLASHAY
jgi:hypothetical protein